MVRGTGRLGPHSIEAEEGLLGAVLTDASLLPQLGFVAPADFFELKHAWVWDAVQAVAARGEDVDNLSVAEEMRKAGRLADAGGPAYLSYLINAAPTWLHAETYAHIVHRAAVRRGLMDAAGQIAQMAREENADLREVLAKAQSALAAVVQRGAVASSLSGADVAAEALAEAEGWLAAPADVRGLSSGIAGLDRALGGFQPGTMVAVAGETSMGKSVFCTMLVRHFARAGRGLYVPTETLPRTAFHKMAGDMAGVPYKAIRAGRVLPDTAQRLYRAYCDLVALGKHIVIMSGISPSVIDIRAEVARLQADGGCAWVVVDSGSKLADGEAGDTDYARVTRAAHGLQDVALQGVVVVASWQIGRNTKDRLVKLPQLHDFKNSGAVEENADVCLGLYRHDYFVARGLAKPDPAYPTGTAQILVLKDRAGGAGDDSITVGFVPGKGFYEIAKGEGR